MRRLLPILLVLIGQPLWSQSAPTVVTDTIVSAGGGNPSGTITISWGRYQDNSVPRRVIFPGSKTVTVTNGVFSTSLFPNGAALPVGGCYYISYHLGQLNNQTRYWYVPISPTPVGLEIEGTIPCTPQSGVVISPAQIDGKTAQVNYVLTWNGFYGAWAPGGGGGGGNPGGTNGQLQFNNLGSFGGFTVGGDCTLVRPSLICTKTNGVSFAASATTDTTNAANISSGTLANLRGGTGTSAAFTVGSVVFAGSGGAYQQDNSNLFWDFVNKRLGVGTTVPSANVDIEGGTGNQLLLKAVGGNATSLAITDGNSVNTWVFRAATSGLFALVDVTNAKTPIAIDPNTANNSLRIFSTGDVTLSGASDAGYRLDLQKSGSTGLLRLYDQTASTGATSMLIKAGAGQSTTPLITWQDNTSNITSTVGADGSLATLSGGSRAVVMTGSTLGLGSASQLAFRSTAGWDSGTVDTAINRNAIGVIEINNGTPGAFRDLIARSVTATSLAGSGTQCVSADNNGKVTISGSGPCLSGTTLGPYPQTVTAQTSVTILAVTHSRGVNPIANCFDNATPRVAVFCAYTRNVSGDLVFAFNPSFTGLIEVRQ